MTHNYSDESLRRLSMITGHKHQDRTDAALIEGNASGRDAAASPDDHSALAAYSKSGDVYFFASDHESSYPVNLSKIIAQGGTFIGVAGGMEHNFAYWVASRPDRIVLYDVNPWALKLAKAKCELLLTCESYEEFTRRFDRIFKGKEAFAFESISSEDVHELVLAGIKLARIACFLTPIRDRDNGWDKPDEFATLKSIISTVDIEHVHGDVLNTELGNRNDVSLIFVSDIFGIGANWKRKDGFVSHMKELQRRGSIRADAQIIDGAGENQVLLVQQYT